MPGHDRSPPPAAIGWAVGPGLTRADIPGLCDRLRLLLAESDATVVVCDVSAMTRPDMVAVEALTRLQLTARHLGCRLQLHGAGQRLRELLDLTGLDAVLPTRPPGEL